MIQRKYSIQVYAYLLNAIGAICLVLIVIGAEGI